MDDIARSIRKEFKKIRTEKYHYHINMIKIKRTLSEKSDY